jgi:serine/threonine protein kinase/DNA-directed RNA polymerase subunit RPC12/RpoP
MKFFCVHCGQKMAASTVYGGRNVQCPTCGTKQAVPPIEKAVPGPPPVSRLPNQPSPGQNYSIGFWKKESIDASAACSDRAAAQMEYRMSAVPDSAHPSAAGHRQSASAEATADRSETGNAPPPKGIRAGSALKQVIQSNIDRSHRTISQFMQEKQLEGVVNLNATDDPSSASKILTSDEGHKYQLGNVVATGGMGAIIDAQDTNIRRNVAMKVVLDPENVSKETILRFIQEAQITGQLEHPSIVPVYELGVDASGNVFYTMKFVRGVTLKDVLSRIADCALAGLKKEDREFLERYPFSRLLNIFQKVCDAIAFAHSKRVVHRDLKPENIMIGDFGEVLVMDWGLAKVMPKKAERPKKRIVIKGKEPAPKRAEVKETDTPSIHSLKNDLEHADALKTLNGSIMGTPGYMAPEQAMGWTEEIGPCTDIYALGAILYNILTLEPPVKGRDLGEVLRNVATGNIPSPTSFNPSTGKAERGDRKAERTVPGEPASRECGSAGTPRPAEDETVLPLPHLPGNLVPDSLSAVCMKALALGPASRYPTVQELQKEIEAFQGGFATSAENAGACRQVQLFLRRHKTAAILSSLAALGIIAGSIAAVAQSIAATRERNRAREALSALKGTAPALMTQARAYIEQGDAGSAAKQATYAAELMPDSPEYLVFKGDMLECALKLNAASAAYEKALECLDSREGAGQPSGTKDRVAGATAPEENRLRLHAQQNLALCRRLLAENKTRLTTAAVTELHIAMRNQDRFAESFAVMRHIGKDTRTLDAIFKAILDKRGVKYRGLTVDNNGKCSLVLDGSGTSDLRLLQGLPLTSLTLTDSPVTDLSPLKGMPLTSLDLQRTRITDLSPLKGMPLTELNLLSCPISDLTPIRGMLLKTLNLSRAYTTARIADLSPLKGMPLMSLNLERCSVADLSPLKGMPLTWLNISGCPVNDLSPLKGMRTLMQMPADPWPIVGKPVLQAVRERNTQASETEAKKLVADWSDVPAMARIVQQAKLCLDVVIPLMKNPDHFPAGTKVFNGHHYYLCSVPMAWDDAKKFCESIGGHLVTIANKEEKAFLLQLTEKLDARGPIHCHIGLTKDGATVRWITDETWDPTLPGTSPWDQGPCGCLATCDNQPRKRGDVYMCDDYGRPFVIEWSR